MQPISKFFFALLLVNVLVLNLIYVFSEDESPHSYKTDNAKALFVKETPASTAKSASTTRSTGATGSIQQVAVASKQEVAVVTDEQPKNASKVPSKESIAEQQKKAEALLKSIKKERESFAELVKQNQRSPFEHNPYKLLGGYKKVDLKYYKDGTLKQPNFDKANYHLIHDEDYCDRVDFYNLAHSDNMFQESNFFTDVAITHPRKQVIDKVGNVPMKQYFNVFNKGKFSPYAEGKKYHLDVTINNFFVYYANFHFRHEILKDYNCATQMYNRIPGSESMARKDLSTDNLKKYLQSFGDKTQCYPEGIFPQSYRLYDMDECFKFFGIINSQAYNESLEAEPLQYLVKVGRDSHRSDGVFLLDGNKTKSINEAYSYGVQCGVKNESLIAQAYVANPLLLDMNNKFDFRVYMLVASTNPLVVYYHDGFLRVALSSYNKRSRERGTHLTNTHLAQKKFDEAKNGKKFNGMNETELMEYHQWSFEELENYLFESGKVTDRDWLDNYLRPAFKKAFIHVTRMAKSSLWNGSNVYQLFGLDFMLDDQLKLWFIEGNPNPQLAQSTQKAADIVNVMLKDLFEVQYAYYRSRMQRVKKVIEALRSEYKEKRYVDYKEWSATYSTATKNRIDSPYEIRSRNTWSLVMDENLPGTSAYQGMIPEGCA